MSGSQQPLPLSTIFPINSATNPATHSYLHHDNSYSAQRPSEAANVPAGPWTHPLSRRQTGGPERWSSPRERMRSRLQAAPRKAPQAIRQARRLVGPSYQLLDPEPFSLLSPHIQSTRQPSSKRYDKRYGQDLLETFPAKSQRTSGRNICLANSPSASRTGVISLARNGEHIEFS
jgi:hypothetical protein